MRHTDEPKPGRSPAARLARGALMWAAARTRGIGTIRRPATGDAPEFDLRYVRSGPRGRTPIVVVPGGPGLASVLPYRGLRRRLTATGCDVIMVEHRGIGLSRTDLAGRDLPFSAMWVTSVVEDIAAVLDHEQVSSAFMVGSSYGSHLVSGFGVRHPERVAGMLLDSTLQSVADLALERRVVRELFWDADDAVAGAVRTMADSGADQRLLLDVIRAAYELGGRELLLPLLRQRQRHLWHPVWKALEAYATRDGSGSVLPGLYEFDIAGAIGFRELGYGAPPDGLPLDPALTYAPVAGRFPPFLREAFDLAAEMPGFPWPMVLLAGNRDLRTPPAIARRVAAAARDAVLVTIDNGHSALETHPVALVRAVDRLVSGQQHRLPQESAALNRLPRRGLAARFPALLGAGVRAFPGAH